MGKAIRGKREAQGPTPQHQFLDPSQERIYENLRILGLGPAAFFQDACSLMANPQGLQTTLNLVAHLLREMESALRSAFLPLTGEARRKKSPNKSRNRDACPLLRLYQECQKWVHRRGLASPPPVDKKFLEFWKERRSLVESHLQKEGDLGSGSLAFFQDACRLMENPDKLQSTAHLVAHLLREAIGPALKPLLQKKTEDGADKSRQKENQREEICVILRSLGIPEKSSVSRAWFALADKLPKMAHRCDLDPPRPVDEIRELWTSGQFWLELLSPALRNNFFKWLSVLDKLLKEPQPTKNHLQTLTQKVPNNRIFRQYFFERSEAPAWLELLKGKGWFQHPPQVEYDDKEGCVSFSRWPEAGYLVRAAKRKPELVAQIIQEMDHTDNPAVLLDLVGALLAMPPDRSISLVDKVVHWAECPYLCTEKLPNKLGELLAHWAKEGPPEKKDEALRVASVLLDILPANEAFRPPFEPQARLDVWNYKRFLKNHYLKTLIPGIGLPALKLLCDLLGKAIGRSRMEGPERRMEDDSFIWRNTIEIDPQNIDHTIRDALVSAVLDASTALVKAGQMTIEEVVIVLEWKRFKIFWRIALHLLRVFSGQAEALVAPRLTDRSLFEDEALVQEYGFLLGECGSSLN
ncbi:hypothetical protein [Methylacidimicrobium sp. B4]|uniref:hypothetical protein n=1 Tax=Methylacidimicrobium sp. B4 TaxID=2796139 RepID=UPI001A8F5817|nr:hypothetical protein [Methylacidimicrobium sp. B4]QSR85311.1 hypothetical protein MacB4_03405 [Methylacidimicrobium sp. B4]